jgi:tetratricopeptide (TPR) repeat protein
VEDLEQRLDRMLGSDTLDPGLVEELMALPPDYPGLDRILAKLTAAIGDQPVSPPMDIDDFYRPGTVPYTLRWPLAAPTLDVLPMGFEALDHKTQFFVLFQEWTRRELEANTARNAGDLAAAQAIFEECLARAEQLDVAELRARSHEGLGDVYEKLNDRDAARRELQAAMTERAGAAT